MKIDLYTQSGEKKGTVDVSDVMFKSPVNDELIRLAVMRQMANARNSAIAHVKGRGDVSGGGRKPWRQKGTGRARFGSSRNPVWRGGGIAFGPTNERNYTKAMNKKERRAALFSAISQKVAGGQVFALDTFTSDKPKTKGFVDMMAKLPVERSLLVVLSDKDAVMEKSASNIENVKTILVDYMNPCDLLKYEKVMFMESA